MGKKISELSSASALTGTEEIPLAQNGQTRKVTPEQLAEYADTFNLVENADTYVNWQSKKSGSLLPVGEFIEITDKADLGIVLYCVSANQFSLAGTAGFLNADFQTAGVYTGVAGYAGWLGQWHSGLAAVAINKVAIYNGLHYKNLTGAVGTAPSGDAVNWVVLTKVTANVGYIEEWDAIEYDFTNDYITKRKDNRSNWIEDEFNATTGAITAFQWGNDAVYGNTCIEISSFSCLNNRGAIEKNHVFSGSDLTATTNAGALRYNSVGNSSTIIATSNSGNIEGNNVYAESTVTATSNTGDIQQNEIKGVLTATTNAGVFLQNKLSSDATITANLNGGVSVRECLFSFITCTMPVATNYTGKTCISGFSNFNCTISITGLTTLNITAANNFCGIIAVTGGVTENLTDITNRPSLFPYSVYPASGLTLTLTADAVPTAANKIALGAATRVLVGTNGDWIQLEQDRLGTGYSQEVNFLIYN